MKFLFNRKIYLFTLFIMITILSAGCSNDSTTKSHTQKRPGAASQEKAHMSGPEFLGGHVEETMNSGGYTYMLLAIGTDKIWVATPQIQVKVGDDVVLMPGQEMKNFQSKTLNRTFESIIFSPGPLNEGGAAHAGMGGNPGAKGRKAASHGQTVAPLTQGIKVEKARGENAFTVAELYEKSGELKGKQVKVRGKIVKVSKNIMGKNWIHIQDGTGSVDKGNFDLTVTTGATPAKDDVVTVTGMLEKEKDFGYGYHYSVIVEDATVEK